MGSTVANIREDGRAALDFRNLQIVSDVVPGSNGSCEVRQFLTSSRVLCSVKAELVDVTAARLNSFSAVTVKIFDSESVTNASKKLVSRKEHNLQRILARPLSQLFTEEHNCIVKDKMYYVINVDFSLFQCDGNPIDLLSIALFTALQTAKSPALETFQKVDFKTQEKTDQEFDLAALPEETPLLNPVQKQNLFVAVTLFHIGTKEVLVDASKTEMDNVTNDLTVFTTVAGNICGVNMGGENGGIPLPKMQDCISMGRSGGLAVLQQLSQLS